MQCLQEFEVVIYKRHKTGYFLKIFSVWIYSIYLFKNISQWLFKRHVKLPFYNPNIWLIKLEHVAPKFIYCWRYSARYGEYNQVHVLTFAGLCANTVVNSHFSISISYLNHIYIKWQFKQNSTAEILGFFYSGNKYHGISSSHIIIKKPLFLN